MHSDDPPLLLIGKVEPDKHRLPEQVTAARPHPYRPISVVLCVERQIRSRRLMDVISSHERLGVDVIVVLRKRRIALAIVSDEVIPIREEPPGHLEEGQLIRVPV